MNILLIDDHPAVQMGIRELLSTEFSGLQVQSVRTEEAALQTLQSRHWASPL